MEEEDDGRIAIARGTNGTEGDFPVTRKELFASLCSVAGLGKQPVVHHGTSTTQSAIERG